jgi:hypothetical protein
MQQIVIQKKYIVAIPRIAEETGETLWRFFIMSVNYFLNISKKSGKITKEVKKEVVNMIDVTENFLKEKMGESFLLEAKNDFENKSSQILSGMKSVFNLFFEEGNVLSKEIESKIVSVKNVISESFLIFRIFLNNLEKNVKNIFEYYFAEKKFVFIKIYNQNNLNIKNNNKSDFEIYKNLLAPPAK